jgi:hypothetical protein
MKLAAPETARSRRALASMLVGVVGGIVFRAGIHTSEATVWIPLFALFVAAGVALVPHLGAQLLARALWWSNLVLGAILCFIGSHSENGPGIALVLGSGGALLLADRRALAAAAEVRDLRPAAFAGTIELVAILALADAQTLLLFAAISLDRSNTTSLAFLACAMAFVVGFVGLYRLALWGVIVTMSTAALLGTGLVTGVLTPHHDMVTALEVLCAAQIAAPVPMLLAILTKRPLRAASPRMRSVLASSFVGIVMLAAIGYTLVHWQ